MYRDQWIGLTFDESNTGTSPAGRAAATADFPIHGLCDRRPTALRIGGGGIVAGNDSGTVDGPVLEAMLAGAGFRSLPLLDAAGGQDRLGLIIGVDLLILDLRGLAAGDAIDRAVRPVLVWPSLGEARLLVLFDSVVLDQVVAELDGVPATLLCDASASELALCLCELAAEQGQPGELNDISRDEEGSRLDMLSEEVRRLAKTIDFLARRGPALRPDGMAMGEPPPPDYFAASAPALRSDNTELPPRRSGNSTASAAEVRALLQMRRLRDRYLPAGMFADPAWDMILDLLAARLEGKRVSVSSLCIAAAVPPTTALRWIGQLTDRGIFLRNNDPDDARRVFIALTDEVAESALAWFAAARRNGLRLPQGRAATG